MRLLTSPPVDSGPADAQPALDEISAGSFADGFKALGDVHRLRILHLLLTWGEMCVCEFVPALDLRQSNISFHLKTLRQARLIKPRRVGKWAYYSLNRLAFEQFLGVFGRVFDLEKWPEKPRCAACDDILHSTTGKKVITELRKGKQ